MAGKEGNKGGGGGKGGMAKGGWDDQGLSAPFVRIREGKPQQDFLLPSEKEIHARIDAMISRYEGIDPDNRLALKELSVIPYARMLPYAKVIFFNVS